jgi:uncharacterized protein YndB with AHSA1/START domain
MTIDYQPGKAVDAEVRQEGSRWTLVFIRELRHPPSRVWEALTDPDDLREWAPFDPNRNLGTTGAATLTMVGTATPTRMECDVRRADPPHVLEYTWGDDVVRWELEDIDAGTRLTLSHTLVDRIWLPKVATGWHMCIDLVEHALAGSPIGRIAGKDAKLHGWERLNAEYSEQLGIENTGWPAEMMSEESGDA